MTHTPRIHVVVFAVVGTFAVAGCAAERYVRQTSQILSEDVISLRSDLARFMEGHERTAARRVNAVVRQRQQREAVEEAIGARLKDSPAASIHQDALDRAQRVIAAEQARATARAAEREAVRKTQEKLESDLAVKLDELVNQLKDLSVAPSFKERASFFAEYFKRTKTALEEAEKADKKP